MSLLIICQVGQAEMWIWQRYKLALREDGIAVLVLFVGLGIKHHLKTSASLTSNLTLHDTILHPSNTEFFCYRFWGAVGSPNFTMPAKGASTRLNPVRLQTIQHLRVRRPNQQQQNSCATIMSSMLSTLFRMMKMNWLILHINDGILSNTFCTDCWASAGQGNEGCSGLEESLKACMDGRVRLLLIFISTCLIAC